MRYIEMRVIARLPIEDLAHYEAGTVEEAARNQDVWYRDGDVELDEILNGAEVQDVHFVGVETEE